MNIGTSNQLALPSALSASGQITQYCEGKREVLPTLLREHRAQRCLVFTADNAAHAIARGP